jgi:hypothetical protein
MAYPQQDTHGNVQMHDELTALFSRNMTFNPDLQPAEATQQSQVQDQSTAPQKVTYSASQHYYHSAHIAKPQVEQAEIEPPKQIQRPSSVPPQSDVIAPEVILRNYGVDPSNLTSAQIQLFKTAEDQQKLRLLELWSICPPSGAQNISALAWSSTSLEQEEHLARVRYERTQQEQGMVMDNAMSQNANDHWTQPESEPYMASGYEELMRREQEQNSANDKAMNAHSHFGSTVGEPSYTKATDPVYLGPDYAREQQQMEMATQYGAFEYFRGTPAVDVMDVM